MYLKLLYRSNMNTHGRASRLLSPLRPATCMRVLSLCQPVLLRRGRGIYSPRGRLRYVINRSLASPCQEGDAQPVGTLSFGTTTCYTSDDNLVLSACILPVTTPVEHFQVCAVQQTTVTAAATSDVQHAQHVSFFIAFNIA